MPDSTNLEDVKATATCGVSCTCDGPSCGENTCSGHCPKVICRSGCSGTCELETDHTGYHKCSHGTNHKFK